MKQLCTLKIFHALPKKMIKENALVLSRQGDKCRMNLGTLSSGAIFIHRKLRGQLQGDKWLYLKTILLYNPYSLRLYKLECTLKVNKQTTPKNRLWCWLTGWISAGYLELEESLHLPDLGLKGSWWSLSSLETNRKAIEPLKVLLLTENYDGLMMRCSGGGGPIS